MPRFDVLVFIGRFQPPHVGHFRVVETALKHAGRVLVLCGSTDQARSIRDPWSFDERREMIQCALDEAHADRVVIRALRDIRYDDERWIAAARAAVASVVGSCGPTGSEPAVGLIGSGSAGTGYYTRRFAGWDDLNVPAVPDVSGRGIRDVLFEDRSKRPLENIANKVTPEVLSRVEAFTGTAAFAGLRREAEYVARYRSAWANSPFTPIFVTVDAVVVQSGHVLLVRRGREPGRGLCALPGGFVDPSERLQQACLRELKEETCLDVDERVLAAAFRRHEVFDDPHRAARGRIITHVYLFALEPARTLPAVTGSDDAEQAFWAPLEDLEPGVFFEDHYAILQVMLGIS